MFKSLPFALGLLLFSIYLLSFSGKFHVMDELAVFTAGYNLAQHGRADINQLIWTNHWTPNPPGIWGSDDNLYTKKPPGISFITAPLIWLGHALPGLDAVHTGLLTNALVTALTASLLFIWLTNLGFARSTATLTTLGYGLCTIAWVYARMFWESSLLALFFLAAVWAAYRATCLVQPQRQWLWLLLCGLSVAISLTLRFEAAIALALIGFYLAYCLLRTTHHAPRTTHYALRTTFYLTPSLLFGLGLLYFNYLRYGSIGETGYTQEILFQAPWVGAYGLLFSPGRGLFIYSPLLLLLFFGLRPAWRRLPHTYFWLIVTLCLCYWLFYGSWFAWGGAWGWGPRFLLPILPLLMLFVAEAVEAARRRRGEEARRQDDLVTRGRSDKETRRQGNDEAILTLDTPRPTPYALRPTPHALRPPPHASRLTPHLSRLTPYALRSTLYALALLSLIVNLLGILVDFNEHFMRLGAANEDFVFNWAVFPPLAHWQILQEGLVDLIWLRPGSGMLQIEWSVLLPALILFVLATINLIIIYRRPQEIRTEKGAPPQSLPSSRLTPHLSRLTSPLSRLPSHLSHLPSHLSPFILLLLALVLTYLTLRGTARTALADEQAQLDRPVLDTLATSARPGDVLLVPMPPFGDVQEISTRLMASLGRSLPTYAWIESDPRAVQPAERTRIWQAAQVETQRAWLFERWLTQEEPATVTAVQLNREAFPLQTQWFEKSGRLTLYALADQAMPGPTSLNVPFQGGLTLLDFTVSGDKLGSGGVLKLRLTWQAAAGGEGLPPDSLIVFAQLLDAADGQQVAQNDRLLVDLQHFKQSPLLPGQTLQQGYGLQLPAALAPGAYSLVVGLYQAGSGQRLLRADGSPDDFLYLTTVQVVGQ